VCAKIGTDFGAALRREDLIQFRASPARFCISRAERGAQSRDPPFGFGACRPPELNKGIPDFSPSELAPWGGDTVHFILLYDVVENFVENRMPFRAAHLAHARAAFERGELVLAGALAEPADSAVIVFRGRSPESAENFARKDPYVTNGLVRSWRVRKWMTVIGDGASPPPL
jgi:uncharacterized protein